MLLLYLRIFSDSGNSKFRRACWAVIAFCTVYYFATVIEDLLQTTPLSYFWLVSFQGCSYNTTRDCRRPSHQSFRAVIWRRDSTSIPPADSRA
jgi:hypothetical protein